MLYLPSFSYWPYALSDLWWTIQWSTRVAITKHSVLWCLSEWLTHSFPLLWPHTCLLLCQEAGYVCSTRQVTFDGILLVHPGTVITEFPGTQTGVFFEPILTCPTSPSFALKFCWSFLDRSSVFGVLVCFICWHITPDVVPNVWFFHMSEWWKIHKWENNEELPPSGHLNESNPVVLYSWMNML